MTRPLTIAACLALSLAAIPALAQDPAGPTPPAPAAVATPAAAPAASAEGDAERGRSLTYTCQGCHGVEGYKNAYPHYNVPKIGGQSLPYLVNALNDYRSGARKHPTMQAQAQGFSEQDVADIAVFLSNLK